MIVTIDMICLRLAPKGIETLLVKRSNPNRPDCGLWAIPGGWVFDEDLSAQGGEPADKDFDSARRRICRQKIHTYPTSSVILWWTVILNAIQAVGASVFLTMPCSIIPTSRRLKRLRWIRAVLIGLH